MLISVNRFSMPLHIKILGLQTCWNEYNCGYTWLNGYFLHEQGLPFSQKESGLVRFELSVSEQFRKSQLDGLVI